jgi:putative ABC transport system permease protein
MQVFKQIAFVVGMNTLALRSRVAASLVIVIGMGAVVAVTLSVFSLTAGLQKEMKHSTPSDTMIVLSQGAANEFSSSISRDNVPLIAEVPGIRQGTDGKPLVSAHIMTNYVTRKKSKGTRAMAILFGEAPNLLEMRPDIKLVAGRMFTPGRREVVVGDGALIHYEDVALGGQIMLQDGPWDVVGVINVPGPANDSFYTDIDTLMSALRRTSANSVMVRLTDSSKDTRERFIAALKSNPALSVDAQTAAAYGATYSKPLTAFYTFLAYGVGVIMGLGAIFAALNTMYAAVSARATEIATLRAIGFGAAPVVISIVTEALTLAVIGAVSGATIAWLLFDGYKQDMGPATITHAVTPGMVLAGVIIALIVGTIGALFPAIRAARLPVTTALQAR